MLVCNFMLCELLGKLITLKMNRCSIDLVHSLSLDVLKWASLIKLLAATYNENWLRYLVNMMNTWFIQEEDSAFNWRTNIEMTTLQININCESLYSNGPNLYSEKAVLSKLRFFPVFQCNQMEESNF